jgi:hypothetical protein
MTEAVAEPKHLHPYWTGMLCAETREDIAQRMRNVLEGRRFTYVHSNSYAEDPEEYRYAAVDVNTTQRLTRPVEDRTDSDDGYTHIGWSITDYAMGVSTKAKTQAEGREGKPYDYVSFNFTPRRIVIEHFAPSRSRLRWEFVLEDHIEDRLLEPDVQQAFREGWQEADRAGAEGDRVRRGMAAAIKEARWE